MTNAQRMTKHQCPGDAFGAAIKRANPIRHWALVILWALVIGHSSLATAPVRAVDEVIDSVMFTDPDVPAARVVKVFPQRLTGLWLRALERPEIELKCQAATTIALAHRRGMAGLEATVAPLL